MSDSGDPAQDKQRELEQEREFYDPPRCAYCLEYGHSAGGHDEYMNLTQHTSQENA